LIALQKKGEEFERDYLRQLREEGKQIAEIDKKNARQAREDTIDAMATGADIIYQARLEHDVWNGWADFLVKTTDRPSQFGAWSYEVMDTKLSRETKAGAILQVCLYSEILKELQGSMPVLMHINNPNGKYPYRVDDFL